jgi:hypothetical protein
MDASSVMTRQIPLSIAEFEKTSKHLELYLERVVIVAKTPTPKTKQYS